MCIIKHVLTGFSFTVWFCSVGLWTVGCGLQLCENVGPSMVEHNVEKWELVQKG